MRLRVRVVWACASGVLAACGSTGAPTTRDQGVDSSTTAAQEMDSSSPEEASDSPGGNQPPGSDASPVGPSDATGPAHPDASGSPDGAGGVLDAGTEAGKGDAGSADAANDAGKADAASPRCKRGIAANAAPGPAFSPSPLQPGISWWYNWALHGSGQGAGIEFVPMIWGSGSLHSALPGGSRYVLGFNEPNFKSQSNLTPAQAAADWPSVEAAASAVGALIISPAVNFCGSSSNPSQCSDPTVTDPYTYLKDFFADCSGCEVDAIAIHWYNCDLPSLRAYIEGNVDAGGGLQGFVQFGKPIWLTEFSCDSSHPVAEQKAYMQSAVSYLESNPHVFRYSWFSASNIASAQLANADGTLTDLGNTYVALPQNCP